MHHGQGFLSPPPSPYHLMKRAKHRALLVRLPFSFSHFLSSREEDGAQNSTDRANLLLPVLIVLRGRRSTELHR